jgi:hypothetical protein
MLSLLLVPNFPGLTLPQTPRILADHRSIQPLP